MRNTAPVKTAIRPHIGTVRVARLLTIALLSIGAVNAEATASFSDFFAEDIEVQVSPDGASANIVESAEVSRLAMVNDPGAADTNIVLPAQAHSFSLRYNFSEPQGNDDLLVIALFDALLGPVSGELDSVEIQETTQGAAFFDLSAWQGLTLGVSIELLDLDPAANALGTKVLLSDLRIGESIDSDDDSIFDPVDNCVADANEDQLNSDGDTLGDVCDADDENDGMPDEYELANGLNPLQDDSLLDADGDGLNNVAEFRAGTSASDPLSIPNPPTATAKLAAAVLPASRSAMVNQPVSAFASMINLGDVDAIDCGFVPAAAYPASFEYARTNPDNNVIVGERNEPATIPAGDTQTFFFGFTPNAPFEPTPMALRFECVNTGAAPVYEGLNTLLVSASEQPVADVIVLAGTASGDGVVRLVDRVGAFAIATVNIGASDTLNVRATATTPSSPVSVSVCRTDALAQCIDPGGPSSRVEASFEANSTATFSFFVESTEQVTFNPAENRISVFVEDGNEQIRGASSVAVVSD